MCECVSEEMSPYCPAHDEWLIMKVCMYVVYHVANNVSNFGGDPMSQLNFPEEIRPHQPEHSPSKQCTTNMIHVLH